MNNKTNKKEPTDEEILCFLKEYGFKPDEITKQQRDTNVGTWIYFSRWRHWIDVKLVNKKDKWILVHLLINRSK